MVTVHGYESCLCIIFMRCCFFLDIIFAGQMYLYTFAIINVYSQGHFVSVVDLG